MRLPDRLSLWKGAEPLLLASQSQARGQVLASAGVPFDTLRVEIDERAIEASLKLAGENPRAIAIALGTEKALTGSKQNPGRLVLGADQTLSLRGVQFHKPADMKAAAEQLGRLAGETHELTSAYAFVRGGKILAADANVARLTMRPLGSAFIQRYLETAGPGVLQCVGVYQIEGLGVHLFDRVEGDHATVMGLPILPVLRFLRMQGLVES